MTFVRICNIRLKRSRGRDKVEEEKKKQTCQNLYGTAPTRPNDLLRPATPSTQLDVSRVHYNTKADEVVEYVRVKTGFILRVVRLVVRSKFQ
jgi:hypothetical protein